MRFGGGDSGAKMAANSLSMVQLRGTKGPAAKGQGHFGPGRANKWIQCRNILDIINPVEGTSPNRG